MKQFGATFLNTKVWLFAALLTAMFSVSAVAGTPTFSVAFSPTIISSDQVSTMTYTIDSSSVENEIVDLAFTNTFPEGMTVAIPSNELNYCTGGSSTVTEGSDSITFSGYRLGSGDSCTFSVNVTASTAGIYTNTTGDLTSSGGNSGSATANLVVDDSGIQMSMSFSPGTIGPDEISTLTYNIDGTGLTANVILMTMSHSLTGLTVSDAPNVSSTCTDIGVIATAGSNSISIDSGQLTLGTSCTLSVDVTGDTADTYTNSTSLFFYRLSNFQTFYAKEATAVITIELPLMYATFPASASPGSSINLTYNITNFTRTDITNLSFTNDLNATLSGLTATALPTDDFCGSGSTMSGTSDLNISGVNLTSGSSCSFGVTVLVPVSAAVGSYTNSTSTINLDMDGSAEAETAITNTLLIQAAPTLTATIVHNPVSAGDSVTFRYAITNTDTLNQATDITFTQNINDVVSGTTVQTLPSANSCGTGSTFITSTDNGELYTFNFLDGSLAAGASCTFDLVVSLAASANVGSHIIPTSGISATVEDSPVYGPNATTTLEISSAPRLTVAITEDFAVQSDTVTAEFTLSYSPSATSDVTDVGFTVDLDAALTGLLSSTDTQTNVCGSGSTFGGTDPLTLSGATLSPDSECSFSVTLTIPADAAAGEIIIGSSIVSGTVAGLAVSNAVASDNLTITGLTLSQAYIPDTLLPGGIGILRYTISNAATALAATQMEFTNSLSDTLSSLQATSLPDTPCGVGSSVTGRTSLTFSGGSLGPGENCTFDIPILIPAGASEGSYVNATSAMTATVNSNNTSSPAASAIFTIESLSVLLSTTADASTSDSPIPVAIYFSRNVTNFIVDDLTIGNGTAGNFAGSGQSYTVDITPTADGTVTIDLPADVVDDSVDGSVHNSAAAQLSVEYTTIPAVATPSMSISAPSLPETSSGPVTYTVTYTDTTEINLTKSAITLDATGTNAIVTVTGGDSTTATVTLSAITGDGTLGFSISANTARNDSVAAPAAGPSDTFNVDNTDPGVTISDSVNPDVNAPFTTTITFSEAVTGFSKGDITVAKASLSDFTATSSTVYTVLVTPTSEGDVTLDISSNIAVDSVDNGNSAAVQHVVNYDVTKPTVVISGATGPIKDPVTVTFTCDEDISGFSQGDISVSNASLSAFTASSASIYTVLVSPTSDGTVTVDVAAGVGFDAAGNSNTAASQYSVTYDSTAPTVMISSDSAYVNSSFTATFTFSEAVTDFTIADIDTSSGTIDNFITSSSSVYTADITPVSDGLLTVDVRASVTTDLAGNPNNAANTPLNVTFDATKPSVIISGPVSVINTTFTATFTFSEAVSGFTSSDINASNADISAFTTNDNIIYTTLITPQTNGDVSIDVGADVAVDNAGNSNTVASQFTVEYDTTAPTIVISGDIALTKDPVTVTFTFDEDISGFSQGDISVSNASLSAFTANSASIYTVLVSPTSDGTVTVDVAAGVGFDAAGNSNTAASQYSVTYDSTAPTVMISSDSAYVNSSFTATFTFSEAVTDFTIDDIDTSSGTIDNFSTSSSSVYTADITPVSDGIVTVDVRADVATDLAGNPNNAADTPLSVTFDTTKPDVTISGPISTINSPFTATFTFSRAVSGFSSSAINVSNADVSAFTTSDNIIYTTLITPQTNGEVTIDVGADVAVDSVGNSNTAASQFTIEYDTAASTVEISSDSAHVNSSFTATFTFSEAVIGFAIDDIDTTNATTDNFTTIGLNVYTVDIIPDSEGIVTVDVKANVATDLTGNHNNIAGTTLNVTFDATKPSVTVSGPVATTNTPFTATFTFSEAVNGFTISDINVSNAAVSTFTTSDNIVYTTLITPLTNEDVTIDVGAAVAVDNANNSNTAASQFTTKVSGLIDVIKVLQILSGVTPSQPGYLDMNENGKADMGDVLFMLQD
jgi:large repetitive protein